MDCNIEIRQLLWASLLDFSPTAKIMFSVWCLYFDVKTIHLWHRIYMECHHCGRTFLQIQDCCKSEEKIFLPYERLDAASQNFAAESFLALERSSTVLIIECHLSRFVRELITKIYFIWRRDQPIKTVWTLPTLDTSFETIRQKFHFYRKLEQIFNV